MTHTVLWPFHRWPTDHHIEPQSVAPDGEALLYAKFDEVPEADWRRAEAVVSYVDIPPAYHDWLDSLRMLVTPSVGFDRFDLAFWGRRGIPVCNVPDYGTQDVADHALALLLALNRCLSMHTRLLGDDPSGNWIPALNPLSRRLSRSVCGVVGLGRIGTAFVLRAKALGMDVVFYDPYKPNGSDLALNIRRADSLEDLFAQSDFISVHVPLGEGTRNLICAEVLAHAKPGLTLINTARGDVVDIDALYDALKSGLVSSAGLDVLPEEPANTGRPLIKAWLANEDGLRDRVILTPHSAFCTPDGVYDMRFKPGQVVLRYLRDGRLENCVNEAFLAQRR